ncbi:MAG TPA: response regulator [Polyangiaceae bacterium LLY-WYZ-14_1]|nr:response regulator [Polyangiaceae bacterium LLY-WYZ-14_1]
MSTGSHPIPSGPGQEPETTLVDLLLVEDDDDHADLFARALRRGHRRLALRRAANLEAARQAVAQRRPGLVVLDLRVGSEDGCALLAELRAREAGGGHLPIVILTTSDDRQDRERSLAQQADAFLVKPAEPDGWRDLGERLLRLIDGERGDG